MTARERADPGWNRSRGPRPFSYFESHGLQPDWPAFLDVFRRRLQTDDHLCRFRAKDGSPVLDRGVGVLYLAVARAGRRAQPFVATLLDDIPAWPQSLDP